MSQLSVSRPPTSLSFAGSQKSGGGINLPQIQHPLSRLGDPQKLDVRGSSRSGGRAGSLLGRPLPCETPRKSVSQSSRHSKLSRSAPAGPLYESIPEGVEVTHGEPGTTRLPVFGSRASTLNGDVSHREDVQKRVSSRLSMASVQARLEVDELEMLLRDKVKNNFFDIKNRFIANDPEQKGNVSRDALGRIIVTLLSRAVPLSLYNRLLDRIGLKDKLTMSYTEFFSCFREAETNEYPQWMDPIQRHYQDKAVMTAQQVHSQLKEKARQKFLDLAELIPQCNPGGSGHILQHEFRNMLERNNFFMEDEEFDKLWAKYDEDHQNVVKGEVLMKKLGISLARAPSGKLSPIHSPKLSPKAHSDLSEKEPKTPKRGTPLRKREQERLMSLDVEKWLKNKFREGYWQLKEKFEAKDPEKTGLISHLEFHELLADQGLNFEKSYLNTFLARCSVSGSKKGVPYIDFLHKFQDRSEAGVPHKILTDPNHRYNNRVDSATYSTMSAVESQLMNMFQRDFLALLGTFHTIDKIRSDVISQEEFRAAIESRFGLEITDEQFRGLIDKVPLTEDGMVKYPQFMAQFDSRGVAKSLYAPPANHDVVETRTPPVGSDVIVPEEDDDVIVPDAEPERLIIHRDEVVDDFPKHRSTTELFALIKDLLKRRYQDVEKAFYDIDDSNSNQLSQEMMYQLLKKFDIEPEVNRGEIRDLWKTLIVSQRKTLNFYEFVRHFGYSLKSAAFPNAKISPPRRGDADCMQRSRKLNSTSILITDNIRAKIEFLFDDLRREFSDMDPYNTGFISIPEFKDILTELNIHIADWEMKQVADKFDAKKDGRISYIEFLRPFAARRQAWRTGDNILAILNHSQAQFNVGDTVEPPQKGLYGITAKLRQRLGGDWKTLRRAFKKLDSDNTGYLSLPEFRSVLKLANVLLDEDELYHLMSEYDEGLTGNIQYSKFLKSTFRNSESRHSVC